MVYKYCFFRDTSSSSSSSTHTSTLLSRYSRGLMFHPKMKKKKKKRNADKNKIHEGMERAYMYATVRCRYIRALVCKCLLQYILFRVHAQQCELEMCVCVCVCGRVIVCVLYKYIVPEECVCILYAVCCTLCVYIFTMLLFRIFFMLVFESFDSAVCHRVFRTADFWKENGRRQ